MSSWEVSFNRLAIQEYREAREWYAQRSSQAVGQFIAAVDHAVDRIRAAGDSLAVLSGKYRSIRVRKFPFTLVFFARTEREMRVVAVAHTSRRPGYWRRRE
jgi:hypothetical protein